jgi:CheY-like chemotaxis protein
MGGTLGVETELGAGCTFWFDLPTAQENRESSVVAPVEEDMDLGGRPISILYIEDNLANYQVMEDLLENYPGVKLIGAMQGSLGVDLAREHRPGLILLDLHLPDIPGQEVLRRLRAEPATAGIPVVIVSADATPAAIDELLNSGATDFVTKPLDVRRLIQVIQRILEPEKPAA